MTAMAPVAEPSAEPIVRSALELAEDEGLSFAPTPGPGDSEGGEIYPPEGAAGSIAR